MIEQFGGVNALFAVGLAVKLDDFSWAFPNDNTRVYRFEKLNINVYYRIAEPFVFLYYGIGGVIVKCHTSNGNRVFTGDNANVQSGDGHKNSVDKNGFANGVVLVAPQAFAFGWRCLRRANRTIPVLISRVFFAQSERKEGIVFSEFKKPRFVVGLTSVND